MLSNKDFAYILSGKSEASDEGKTRFGLDQIRQWDKQNKLKGKTKHTNKQQKKRDSEGEGASVKTSEESGYRDRAQERRKDVNPDYGHMEGLNELDVEQTKYLGGDTEHTHLVKGLDYALLRKVRSEAEQASKEQDDQSTSGSSCRLADITPVSHMGAKLKDMLLSSNVENPRKMQNSDKLLSRTGYEFDLNPLSNQDLPTIVLRSKQEQNSDSNCPAYIVPANLLVKLTESFSSEKQALRKKSKSASLTKVSRQPPKQIEAPPKPEPVDIFDDVGKYVPELPTASSGGRSEDRSTSSTSKYFTSTSDDVSPAAPQDLMAPVKKLLEAQNQKQKILESSSSSKIVVEEGKKHRDIFGGLEEKKKKQIGHSMTTSSSYDVYPENADYEMYDSDGEEKKKKKPTSTSEGGKPAPSRRAREANANRNQGGAGVSSDGMNRAQRRALQRGDDVSAKRPKHS